MFITSKDREINGIFPQAIFAFRLVNSTSSDEEEKNKDNKVGKTKSVEIKELEKCKGFIAERDHNFAEYSSGSFKQVKSYYYVY